MLIFWESDLPKMETQLDTECSVFDPHTEQALGRVLLNGRHISAGGPLGQSGAMRSFTVVTGDLWEYWVRQQQLLLVGKDGKESLVRVAALPVDRGEIGFLEYVDDARNSDRE